MNGHTSRHQRLLMLLAGFFGFAVTATLSIVPGSGVAEVIRAGTAAAANSAGSRDAARTAAANRDRRSTAVWNRFATADAAYRWHRYRPSAGTKPFFHTEPFFQTGAHAQHAALPSEIAAARPGTYPAGAIASRTMALPSAHLSAVQVRGPPTSTGF
ncbi:hypothetical protein [Actinomadura macra]|uniref:hypothetical protein n=1 Tax=Actinomadura macra TaxID=46164 RepID=UPI00082E9418|nr:hypothetical protein [Actinomadura macra]